MIIELFKKNNIRITTIAYFVVQLILAGLICEQYLYSKNTLYNNGNWVSAKCLLAKKVVGAVEFMVTNTSLARNRLNLGAYHGFQEVEYKDKLNIEYIKFSFLLTRDSYLCFIFNKNNKDFCGIRISANKRYDNIYFVAENGGEFIEKKKLPIDNISAGSWNNCRLVFSKDKLAIYLNDHFVDSVNVNLDLKQTVGFKGGYKDVLIDNVVIKEYASERIIRDSFSNRRKYFHVLGISFLLTLGINLGIVLALGMFFKNLPKVLRGALIINVYLVLFLILIYLSDFYYLSNRYKKAINIPPEYRKNYSKNEKEAGGKFRITYPDMIGENIYKIMFIGTSQTWGAGALKNEDVLSICLEKKLNNNSNKMNYKCINKGISGQSPAILFQYYKEKWIKLDPQVVIINLSNNPDADFRNSLKAFILLNQSKNIKTIFVLEPNSIDCNTNIMGKHKIIKEFAQEYGIQFVDMHNHLGAFYADGFLWWDNVHLTSFGQRKFADILYDSIDWEKINM